VNSTEQKQTSSARALAAVVMAGVLLALAFVSTPGSPSLARQDVQDTAVATPGTPVAIDFSRPVAERPAQIQAGECGSGAEPLAVLTPLEKPEGEAEGQPNAIEAERSYTSIPLSLEALLTGQTNVTVLLDGADDAVVIT
jgi:hypothetical protein